MNNIYIYEDIDINLQRKIINLECDIKQKYQNQYLQNNSFNNYFTFKLIKKICMISFIVFVIIVYIWIIMYF